MSTKHTPGPWFVKKTAMSCFIDARIGGGMLQEVAWCGQTATPEHMAANARLIAAAPDLLALLDEVYFDLIQGAMPDKGDPWYEKARAAIAKATGEQS